MSLLKICDADVLRIVELIHSGTLPEICVPSLWKCESNRSIVDKAYHDACMQLWFKMGDTALNRSGYTNSLSAFWNEIIGKKENQNKTDEVEHWDETWYF